MTMQLIETIRFKKLVELPFGKLGRSFEHHVLKKMGEPRALGDFVARTDAEPGLVGESRRSMVGNDQEL